MKLFFTSILFILSLSISTVVNAQVLKKTAKTAKNYATQIDIKGDWYYEGVAIEFKSDNLLKKAGGKVVASTVSNNLDKELSKLGFESGITSFTFNDDGSFSNYFTNNSLSGKYTFDTKKNTLKLKYLNHIPLESGISGNNKKISLLFESNNFLSLITFIGGNTGISVIDGISSLLGSYDGMMIGITLIKK